MRSFLRWGIPLVVLAVIVLGGWWFWSLGDAKASQDKPQFTLEVLAPVNFKHAGDTDWTGLDGTPKFVDIRVGDQINTGPGGKAQIHWGERGVTRLESDTEITIEAMPDEEHYMTNASIQVRVTSGRVWTRVLKLLDLDSQVTVKTNDVVATVRGTSFGVVATGEGTDVLVSESSVAVTRDGKSAHLVNENEAGIFRQAGSVARKRQLTTGDGWVEDQKVADKKYDEWLKKKMQERLKKHETGNLRLAAQFMRNRGNKEILLDRLMTELQNNPEALEQAKKYLDQLDGPTRQRILADIEAMLFVQGDAAPAKWKEQLQRFQQEMIRPERRIERRMETFVPLPELSPTEVVAPTIIQPSDVTRQPLSDVKAPTPSPTRTPSAEPTSEPTPTLAPLPAGGAKLNLVASPSVGTADQPITLTVHKVVNDQKTDVTGSVRFTFSPSTGTLVGRTFTPTDVGTYTFTATFSDPNAGELRTSLNINVGPPIDIGPASSDTVKIQ